STMRSAGGSAAGWPATAPVRAWYCASDDHVHSRKGSSREGARIEGELALGRAGQGVKCRAQTWCDAKRGSRHVDALRIQAEVQPRQEERHSRVSAEADDDVSGLVDVGEDGVLRRVVGGVNVQVGPGRSLRLCY
ncbi:hypothetical protein KFL_001670150, partial [Klebsormidium nitens]